MSNYCMVHPTILIWNYDNRLYQYWAPTLMDNVKADGKGESNVQDVVTYVA